MTDSQPPTPGKAAVGDVPSVKFHMLWSRGPMKPESNFSFLWNDDPALRLFT
jgi:hypothetical protein